MTASDGAGVPLPIGQIGDYNLLERLDASGPGELFRARDTRKGRTVAIRVLPDAVAPGAGARAGLIEAARSVGVLSHPNVTTLFDAGEHDGKAFLVFEYLTGQSLRAEMAGRAMNIRRAVEVAIQIADAIAQAHAAGFSHAGLSPDSIVVTAKGRAKIPAFPLATREGFETGDGVTLRDYESPEEARGETPDDRSDIYSVGAILFEMLTTRRPPPRGAAAPSAANRNVIPELDDVVLRAVAPNPESRHQSAATLAAELRAISARLDAQDIADDVPLPPRRTKKGRGGLLVAAAIVLLLAFVAWWVTR